MSKLKKLLSTVMALVFMTLVCVQPAQAYTTTAFDDLYSKRATEEVVIDNVVYELRYSYENGNRTITISNSENETVEKVTYNSRTATTCYYRSADQANQNSDVYEWVLMGSDSHRITWAEGMSVAAVAAAIAAGLGFIGGSAVIAAIGTSALSVLAAGAVGGTVYIDIYYMTMPNHSIQYLYIWSFTASTGDSYGPYYYSPSV